MKFFAVRMALDDPSAGELVVGTTPSVVAGGDRNKTACDAVEKLLDSANIDYDLIAENHYGFGVEKLAQVKRLLLSRGWREGEYDD